jgi:hypothetical protein
MAFSFGFGGDDIDMDEGGMDDGAANADEPPALPYNEHPNKLQAPETGSLKRQPASTLNPAFPVDGQPLLPARFHDLEALIDTLPDRIMYHTLTVELDDGSKLEIPRRDLDDIKVQVMAEDEMSEDGDASMVGLGKDDVKTGIYEGGFKSWESSIDVVKVLAARGENVILQEEDILEVSLILYVFLVFQLQAELLFWSSEKILKVAAWMRNCFTLTRYISMAPPTLPKIKGVPASQFRSSGLQPFCTSAINFTKPHIVMG